MANRRGFVRELSRIMAFAERYDTESSLIYFDANGLKPINDTYGHPAGDATLMRIADVLVENVRESDVVGRLGGDEFAVILSQADALTASEKAASLVATIEAQPLDWNGEEIPIKVSYGIYTFKGGTPPAKPWRRPIGRCMRTRWPTNRRRGASRLFRVGPAADQAMVLGISMLRRRRIASLRISFRFFRRCT